MFRSTHLVILLAIVSTAAAAGAGAWLTASAPLAPPLPPAAGAEAARPDRGEIEDRVRRLEARLRPVAEDIEGWKMLGRSYMALGRYGDAVGAWSQAAQFAPRDPEITGALQRLVEIARERGREMPPAR